ncbi:hypothetical protein [Pseudomonas rubra]|uniref:Uncharacterized protein n=1 Tax=Pseudomonas rubra TaxID=2942627 RepID=A0ABT5PC74_9PSED|nr:hypothetical protein [Pseudomonas rubra]MDD1015898.1 hypothetical protein [Pseudomonas rubra]MDD1040198.1 hypothetical protein [Pseudomonas rubra]MDD1157926.1 hypothetical protein [Pseudomonas rubra]
MIESAYCYCEAAKYLLTGHDMMAVVQVNAAIGMEILLKSFVARPSGNHGQVNDTYDLDPKLINDAHRELQHAGKIAADDKRVDKHDLLTFFTLHLRTSGRVFDSTRRNIAMCSQMLDLGQMIESVVKWYRERGCRDVFIVCYGMTPADFQPGSGKEPEPT